MGVSRTGDLETYVGDIEHPRSASLTLYRDSFGWLTVADSKGTETTIFVNLDDEDDRQFVVQLHQAAGVLAIMSAEDGEEGLAMTKGVTMIKEYGRRITVWG